MKSEEKPILKYELSVYADGRIDERYLYGESDMPWDRIISAGSIAGKNWFWRNWPPVKPGHPMIAVGVIVGERAEIDATTSQLGNLMASNIPIEE